MHTTRHVQSAHHFVNPSRRRPDHSPEGVVVPLRPRRRARTAASLSAQQPAPTSQTAQRTRPHAAQIAAIVAGVELALLGLVGYSAWWASLGWATGKWLWLALAAAALLVALHLPLVVAAIWLQRSPRRG